MSELDAQPTSGHRSGPEPTAAADTPEATPSPALAEHTQHAQRYAEVATGLDRRAHGISLARLALFLLTAVFVTAGIREAQVAWFGWAILSLLGFVAAVVWHARTLTEHRRAELRRECHERHAQRLRNAWQGLASRGEKLLPDGHPYARDIDLVGDGSLFQRIDTTHTHQGAQTLARWLGEPATVEAIGLRQAAVRELSTQLPLRRELEVAALMSDQERLDPSRFDAVLALPRLYANRPLLPLTVTLFPIVTLTLLIGGQIGWWSAAWWLLPLLGQLALLRATRREVVQLFDNLGARSNSIEAISEMLLLLEQAKLESEMLLTLQRQVAIEGTPASSHMRRFKRWNAWSELRHQPLVHLVVNPLVLWDLHVLRGLEAWLDDVGRHTDQWFGALGELEALGALATLCDERGTCFPEIAPAGEGMDGRGLEHPLLPVGERVANDVQLPTANSALMITGSNMAGKSTLLRAVGLNLTLAFAGGPVCAEHLRIPVVRLRASMRVDDSLQTGASYFHAELSKLKSVIDAADTAPPVFFLLDELLRGTNARARHIGAWAVLTHLLDRGAMGLMATHDTALARLAESEPYDVRNMHFTDTVIDGEMTFDYRLQPGIVRGSNALRLLAMAGIQVPDSAALQDVLE